MLFVMAQQRGLGSFKIMLWWRMNLTFWLNKSSWIFKDFIFTLRSQFFASCTPPPTRCLQVLLERVCVVFTDVCVYWAWSRPMLQGNYDCQCALQAGNMWCGTRPRYPTATVPRGIVRYIHAWECFLCKAVQRFTTVSIATRFWGLCIFIHFLRPILIFFC